MKQAEKFFCRLNEEYVAVHSRKEELFWRTYMGTSDDHAGLAEVEKAFKAFISDAAKLKEIRRRYDSIASKADSPEKKALLHGLGGWRAFFECNVVESEEAKKLQQSIIETETRIFADRKQLQLKHIDASGTWVDASLVSAGANMLTNENEEARKSSHEALKIAGEWVLDNGYLELVKERNRYARALGYSNYFAYKLHKEERMNADKLFRILDSFEAKTRRALQTTMVELIKKKGAGASEPYNLRFNLSGDTARKLDRYVPFAESLSRWIRSFYRLGIDFRGAALTLDLLERKGKYENGFMHGPQPCFFDRGQWIPARIDFTSIALPDQVGSGYRALTTLFHEGGHAAHFSNITQNAPCFSMEYPPTSMAYAETQSMFCDSLLEDADWLKEYAQDRNGASIPDALIREIIETNRPGLPLDERQMLIVPYFEWGLYQLSDDDLRKETVTYLAHESEKRALGIEQSPRPVLSVPHLLGPESACTYHGYLLAHMAVYQTRAYFLNKFGYITDNPQIGNLLAQHYWEPGNSRMHEETLESLTGTGLSPSFLAESCNRSTEDAWNEAQDLIKRHRDVRVDSGANSLNASIRIVHGNELIADNSDSDERMCGQFETWIASQYKTPE